MKIRHFVLALLLVPVFSLSAQTGSATTTTAGLTPGNPFYFLDRLGEVISEFLTLNPEAKARLQIRFAAERVAEIAVMLEDKGVNAPGIDVAQSRLEDHLTKASKIVSDEKSKGKDVEELSQELKDEMEVSKEALKQSFEDSKDALEQEHEMVKEQLREAKKNNDTAQIEALTGKASNLEAEKKALELKKEEQEKSLESETEKIGEDVEQEDSHRGSGKDEAEREGREENDR